MSDDNNEKAALVPRLRFPEFRNASEWEEHPVSGMLEEALRPVEMNDDEDYTLVTVKRRYCGVVLREVLKGQEILVKSQFRIKKDDFLISKRQIVHCACGIVSEDYDGAIVSNEYTILQSRKNCDISFFGYFSQQPIVGRSFLECSVGIVIEKMLFKQDQWLKKKFLFPRFPEQQKIANCLSSLDELITAETQKLDALKTHKKGLMQQLFPREGETVPRLRFSEFREAREWEGKPLAEVCSVLQGYGFPEVLQGRSEGKYPFCKVSDISRAVAERGGLLGEATNYVGDDDLLNLRAKPIPKGATVFAKIGEALRLNRRAYVQKECLIDNNATGLKAIEGVADDYFVYLLSQLVDLNKHCGGAVPSVNKTTLEEIEVVVPGLDEQKRIAESLLPLDDLITAQSQKIDALKTHKKGLMQQLFPVLEEVQP